MDRQALLECEINLFAHCAAKVRTDFGLLFYNNGNPCSHECNHAHILRLEDPGAALEKIASFFLSAGVTPRLFFSGIENELEILRPYLERDGWEIAESNRKMMRLSDFQMPAGKPPELTVERVERIDEELYALFMANDGGDWCAKAAEETLRHGTLALFAAVAGGVKVGSAGIDRDAQTGLSLVQDVFINEAYRGKGYSAFLVAEALQSHLQKYDDEIYLWVENPIAEHVYRKLGFAGASFSVPDWRAWKKIVP